MAKKASSTSAGGGSSKPARGGGRRGAGGPGRTFKSYTAGSATGKDLVIVESPAKGKTINKYLGDKYHVMASVGHVRDLPSKNPKGVKNPVPGVDLERDFTPTYVVTEDRENVIKDLKRATRDVKESGGEVWFATDLDREGEAIAWHLAQELGIPSREARRVRFPAITKAEIEKAFKNPHGIDEDRVNAQQARRILDRIVGYQVSPLLWKKVARGLSAGRVQSVAVRLVVEREREIRAFVPEESWALRGEFTPEPGRAGALAGEWVKALSAKDEKGNPPTQRAQQAWLASRGAFSAELVAAGGTKIDDLVASWRAAAGPEGDMTPRVMELAKAAGLDHPSATTTADPRGKGPARNLRRVTGAVDASVPYTVTGIETKKTSSRPPGPFITSTLQQAASSRLGFGAQRTMRAAQQLYEGVEIPGEGPVGLITYMRTDSTHLSADALDMARAFIGRSFGEKYLPEKPNFFTSSNKDAQEAHEAIRPTDVAMTPDRVRRALSEDQHRLYTLIWERFVACQMTPAQWDSTSVMIEGGRPAGPFTSVTFRATGRVLVFDGFYKVSGVPHAADEQTLPRLAEKAPVRAFGIEPQQKFTQPPPRYTEASLIKVLESEGIGRPSTYASIIGVIQDRKYVEQTDRRFYATDLGEVVTDKLVEAFPEIMDVGYTRDMETQLDKVEEDHLDWIEMLRRFYGPFKKSLEEAEATLTHAKAETVPAPDEFRCETCGAPTVYRFGRNGRFLSCSRYPECEYASPVDREGVPRPAAQTVDVACHKCGSPMTKRTGRFGPFLGCSRYNDKTNPCDGLLNLDAKGRVVAPSPPPLVTELACEKCGRPMNLRGGVRGPWLGCSGFPKCRGRGKWAELPEEQRKALELALLNHEKANPVRIIRTMSGAALTDAKGKPLPEAPPVGQSTGEGGGTLEAVADEIGV
ncbi:MAG: type I DNA topoisomerase [Phycisphaeraceae bacterium]|nr:MAG: type I DNA topoisomerase [Phycisphaeraceae bacterium]